NVIRSVSRSAGQLRAKELVQFGEVQVVGQLHGVYQAPPRLCVVVGRRLGVVPPGDDLVAGDDDAVRRDAAHLGAVQGRQGLADRVGVALQEDCPQAHLVLAYIYVQTSAHSALWGG